MGGAQASPCRPSRRPVPLGRLSAAVLLGFLCAGCAGGGFSLDKVEKDPSIITGATPPDAVMPVDGDQMSDEATIRNAVTSADIDLLKGAPIPWANDDTGSRGAISSLVEESRAGKLCRRFTTSRERFDGVALYSGQACKVAPGAWRMEKFDAL
jgi:hypothetical protein